MNVPNCPPPFWNGAKNSNAHTRLVLIQAPDLGINQQVRAEEDGRLPGRERVSSNPLGKRPRPGEGVNELLLLVQ